MGKSNNQLRATAKAKNRIFIPKQVKSKARNAQRKMKIMMSKKGSALMHKKLSYNKMRDRGGKIVKRRFRATGGHNVGAIHKARVSRGKTGGK